MGINTAKKGIQGRMGRREVGQGRAGTSSLHLGWGKTHIKGEGGTPPTARGPQRGKEGPGEGGGENW